MKTMEQRNVETVNEFIQVFWNRSELDCVDRFLSDDYQELAYQSKEGLKKFASTIWTHFPINATRWKKLSVKGTKCL
ncbi:ester cyclase [Paenibacillus thalictri]|uniref:ester cyclase n=1 Tax=Paenibacillus thalictri TaxID=2527873 RepID=UPI001F0DC3E1|nr:ester cyclase [Paenibacillus thalictri]